MSERKNSVYFIGAGPGHMKYLTLEGRDALVKCALVFALKPYPDTFAGLLRGKAVHDPFERTFDELVREVDSALGSAPVGFLVPGDLTVFSPFLPVVQHFREKSEVIAGVGIVNAALALLKRTLDMPGVSHAIVLTSPKHIDREGDSAQLDALARTGGTMVLYMNNRPLDQLAAELSGGYAPDTPVAIAFQVGLGEERVYSCTLSTMAEAVGHDDIFGLESGEPSMAIIVVGRVLESAADPAFWDRRKEKFWDRKGRE